MSPQKARQRRSREGCTTPNAAGRRNARRSWVTVDVGVDVLFPAAPEGNQSGEASKDGGDDRAEVAGHIVAAGAHRAFGARELVGLRLVGDQEERMQSAIFLLAVDLRLAHALG